MTPPAETAEGDPGAVPRPPVRWRQRISGVWSALPRRAIKRVGTLTMATGTARIGAVLAAVVVARFLGRASLGRYAAAVAIGAVVVSAPGSGLPIMAIRDVAAGKRGRLFVLAAIRAELVVTTLATGFAVLVSALVIRPVSLAVGLGLLAGVGNISLTQLNLAQGLGLGLQRHRPVVLSQMAVGILLPVFTGAAVLAGLGLPGAVAALAVSSLPCALWTYWALWPKLSQTPDHLDTHHLVWRSRTFVGFTAVNGGYQRIDAVMLLAFSTAAVSGLYASAYRFLGPFDLLEAGFAQVFFPLLSSLSPASPRWQET
ncbi:MAG: oligosaccharide flippase family protein, partial [Acidimicrobiales bacterium]